jgi:hypothetical protein
MRIVIKGVLMGLVVGIAGCNSHDSKQVHNSDRPATSHADADQARGNVQLAPVVNDRAVNQAADQAKGVINTATATADRVIDTATASADRAVNGVNRTAARMQSDVQQTSYDAARLTSDVAKEGILTADPNRTPARIQADVQRAASDAAKLPNDAAREGKNLRNNATRDLDALKNFLR